MGRLTDEELQIAPSLIGDDQVLDEIVERLSDVLTDAAVHKGLGTTAGVAWCA